MFRKESKYTDYGKGNPGHNWEVRIVSGDDVVARAFGPNVNGACIGEFRNLAAVNIARGIPDGPISENLVVGLLADVHAEKLRKRGC